MQRRLQEDELRVLRGEAEVDEAHVDDDSAVSEDAPSDAGRGAQPAPAGFVTTGRGPSFGGGGGVRTTSRGEQALKGRLLPARCEGGGVGFPPLAVGASQVAPLKVNLRGSGSAC